MIKQNSNENAVNIISNILKELKGKQDKSKYLKNLGFSDKNLSEIERDRINREKINRKILSKNYSDLHIEQIPGYLAKFKSLYLLHFYYNGLDILEKHKLSKEGKDAYSGLIKFFISSSLFDMFLKISGLSDLSKNEEYLKLLTYSTEKNIKVLNELIRNINKKNNDIIKEFLENKVEKEKLSKRIKSYFEDEKNLDIFCVIKGFRNKIAHGGIAASISLNEASGERRRGQFTFKHAIKVYNALSNFQIEIIDNWFIKEIKPQLIPVNKK